MRTTVYFRTPAARVDGFVASVLRRQDPDPEAYGLTWKNLTLYDRKNGSSYVILNGKRISVNISGSTGLVFAHP